MGRIWNPYGNQGGRHRKIPSGLADGGAPKLSFGERMMQAPWRVWRETRAMRRIRRRGGKNLSSRPADTPPESVGADPKRARPGNGLLGPLAATFCWLRPGARPSGPGNTRAVRHLPTTVRAASGGSPSMTTVARARQVKRGLNAEWTNCSDGGGGDATEVVVERYPFHALRLGCATAGWRGQGFKPGPDPAPGKGTSSHGPEAQASRTEFWPGAGGATTTGS